MMDYLFLISYYHFNLGLIVVIKITPTTRYSVGFISGNSFQLQSITSNKTQMPNLISKFQVYRYDTFERVWNISKIIAVNIPPAIIPTTNRQSKLSNGKKIRARSIEKDFISDIAR